jgi:hypothetical protein
MFVLDIVGFTQAAKVKVVVISKAELSGVEAY